ncbi:hypothetical protein EV175_002799 [Coemansia sp. RSA 1933]|nr:hypothetical protein EV175_002799 [Coemansia sp. RSA 1933]
MGNTMSFGTTQSEKMRVLAGEMAGVTVDPRGTGDLVMVIVFSILYGIDAVAVIYMLWNRKYPPLKSKSPEIMAAFMAGAVLWFTGDIQVNGHAPLAGTPLTNCKAFGVWVRVLLGVCAVSALIALRSYGLYRVFCRNLPYNGLGLYAPFLGYCLCIAVYGIVSQVIAAQRTIHYVELIDICYYEGGYKASLFALLWATWILVAGINWRIRRIRSSFNESREMLAACTAVFAILIFTTAMHYSQPTYPLNKRLRIVTTSLDHVATNFVWWLIMARPMFQCLFNRKAYLDSWVAKLRSDGLQREYDVASASLRGTSFGDRPLNGDPMTRGSLYLDGGMDPKDAYFYFNGGADNDDIKHAADPNASGYFYEGHLESAPTQYSATPHKASSDGAPMDASSESSLVAQPMSSQNIHHQQNQYQYHLQNQQQQQQQYASVQFDNQPVSSAPLRLNDAANMHLAPFDGANNRHLI